MKKKLFSVSNRVNLIVLVIKFNPSVFFTSSKPNHQQMDTSFKIFLFFLKSFSITPGKYLLIFCHAQTRLFSRDTQMNPWNPEVKKRNYNVNEGKNMDDNGKKKINHLKK